MWQIGLILGPLILLILLMRSPMNGAFVLGGIIFLYMNKGRISAIGNLGTARWASRQELAAAGLLGNRGLMLARAERERPSLWKAIRQIYLAPWRISRFVCWNLRMALLGQPIGSQPFIRVNAYTHFLVCASPGAGKGTCFLINNLLTHRTSTVVLDVKGENFKATARIRKRHLNNRIVRLDPFQICGSGSDTLNPLTFIRPDSPTVCDDCAALADALVVSTGKEQDPHFNEAAKSGLCAAILYVVVYAAKPERNLNTVASILLDPDGFLGMITLMADADGEIAKKYGDTIAHPLMKKYGNYLSWWRERELGSIMSTIGRNLITWMNSPLIAESLATSSWDPHDLVRGPEYMTVYLCIPPQYLHTHGRLLRCWMTTIINAIISNGPQEKRTVTMFLDEIGNCGPMQSLYNAITIGRGYGLRIILILQALAQLRTLFPDEGQHMSVDASIAHRMFFGIRDLKTATEISEVTGVTTVHLTSRTTNEGSSETYGYKRESSSSSTNYGTSTTTSATARKLILPSEILQLPETTCLIFAKNLPPIRGELSPWWLSTPELSDVLPDVNQPLED